MLMNQKMMSFLCPDTIFDLIKKVLNEIEIKVFSKGLGSVPTPNLINEEFKRRDFGEFSRKMTCKWYFKDESTPSFSEVTIL